MMLDYLGILLDANAAENLNLTVNLAFTDEDPYLLTVRSGVVLYERKRRRPALDATLHDAAPGHVRHSQPRRRHASRFDRRRRDQDVLNQAHRTPDGIRF